MGQHDVVDPGWIPERLLRLADALGAGLTAQGRDGRTVWANERSASLLGVEVADLVGSSSRELRWQSVDADRKPLDPDEHPAVIALTRGAAVTGFVMGMSVTEADGGNGGGNTGWEPDDAIGRDASDLCHPDDLPDLAASQDMLAASGTSVVRYRIRRADGTWLPVETISQRQSAGPGLAQILCLTRDVSSEESAEALAERVISESPVGLAILDGGGVIVRTNQAFNSLLQRPPEELADSRYLDLTLDEDRPIEAQLWQELNGCELERFELKKRFLLPDGSSFWSAINVVALPSYQGGEQFALLQATDIDERERVHEQLRASEMRMRTALESLPVGMLLLSEEGTVAFANSAANPGGFSKDLMGRSVLSCYNWLSEEQRDRLVRAIRSQSSLTDPARLTMVVGGRTRLHQLNLIHLGERATHDVSFIAHLQEQPLTAETPADVIERAAHDNLTGLLTRAEFFPLAEQALRNATAIGAPVGLLFCDLDGFKRINDTYGHAVGDSVLAAAGKAVLAGTRESDLVARFGGDEFVVLAASGRENNLESIGAKLARLIAEATGQWGGVGMSYGIAISRPDSTVDQLVRAADTDMYTRRGR